MQRLSDQIYSDLDQRHDGYGTAVKDVIEGGYTTRQEWESPQPADDEAILRPTSLPQGGAQLEHGFLQPDYARTLVVSGADEDSPVTVQGLNTEGGVHTETWTKDGPGKTAFSKVLGITLPPGGDKKGKGGGKRVSVGTTNQFGLKNALHSDTVLFHNVTDEDGNFVRSEDRPKVSASRTLHGSTIEFPEEPDGERSYRAHFIVEPD